MAFEENERVFHRLSGVDDFVAGTILRISSNGTYNVKWDDGWTLWHEERHLLPHEEGVKRQNKRALYPDKD